MLFPKFPEQWRVCVTAGEGCVCKHYHVRIFSPPLHFCASLCTDSTSFSHGLLSELPNWCVEKKMSTKGFHMERLWLKRLFLTLSVPEGISTQIWQRTLGRKLTRHIECLTAERLFKALNQQPDTVKTQRDCGGRALTWAETLWPQRARACHSPDLTSAF